MNKTFCDLSGYDNTYTTTTDGCGSPIPTTGSPERPDRSLSPLRNMSAEGLEQLVADIDPETVRISLRDFAQRLKETEKQRVSSKEWFIS